MNKTSFLVLAAGVALAQQLEFEVATIRPSAGGPGSSVPGLRNGRFSATNASLKALISYAYSMPEMLISGWIRSASISRPRFPRAGRKIKLRRCSRPCSKNGST